MGHARAFHYAAALALAVGFTPAAHAAPLSGNQLLDQCGGSGEEMVLPCLYWTIGVSGGIKFAEAASKVETVCFPEGSTVGQYHDVILAYLKANPTERHLPAEALAYAALRNAFKCVHR